MTKASKTLTVDLKRVIAASPTAVYDAWMDPKLPCNPWNYCKDVILEPKNGKLLYFRGPHSNGGHYGRILKLVRGKQAQFTWMSFYTEGRETTVTVNFKKHAAGTLMTLRHAGLPNNASGRGHQGGWEMFIGMTEKYFQQKKGN